MRENYGYDEFGQDLYGNQGQTQPFGYTGYQPERIAGTYYAQAREYVPSVGKFASRDLDRYMRIQDPNSINLYNYCVSNPMRYVDSSGNSLEEVLNEQFPSSVEHSVHDAVQVDVSKNNIKIDIYVQFTGEVELTTANGTPCKDLAIAGMEAWAGPYMDVFGEDVYVTVEVHEFKDNSKAGQRYVEISLESELSYARTGWDGSWNYTVQKKTIMPLGNSEDNEIFTDEVYLRTVAHETGHLLGIDDGYVGYIYPTDEATNESRIFLRRDAVGKGMIDEYNIMANHKVKLLITNTNIEMLLLANRTDELQCFCDYGEGRFHQSKCLEEERGKE